MNRDLEHWMWREACQFIRRAEQLQRQFFEPQGAGGAVVSWEPPIDIFDTGRELCLVIALPGVDAAHVEVVLDEADVIVRGERPIPLPTRNAAIHRLEIPHGRFERRVTLSGGRFRLTRRELADGCLTLVLARA